MQQHSSSSTAVAVFFAGRGRSPVAPESMAWYSCHIAAAAAEEEALRHNDVL
jgi:hypothetical protein